MVRDHSNHWNHPSFHPKWLLVIRNSPFVGIKPSIFFYLFIIVSFYSLSLFLKHLQNRTLSSHFYLIIIIFSTKKSSKLHTQIYKHPHTHTHTVSLFFSMHDQIKKIKKRNLTLIGRIEYQTMIANNINLIVYCYTRRTNWHVDVSPSPWWSAIKFFPGKKRNQEKLFGCYMLTLCGEIWCLNWSRLK